MRSRIEEIGKEEGIVAISLPDARQLSDEVLQALRLRALRGVELGSDLLTCGILMWGRTWALGLAGDRVDESQLGARIGELGRVEVLQHLSENGDIANIDRCPRTETDVLQSSILAMSPFSLP